jgi:hypothetical protein
MSCVVKMILPPQTAVWFELVRVLYLIMMLCDYE